MLLGKTDKFSADRFLAIVDFLISLEAEGCGEQRNLSHSVDYLACLNSLVEEGLLKKTSQKHSESAASSEQLTQVSFKCNYDLTFIEDVAEKIDFKLHEYLYTGEG